ncbi:MAG: PIN domain-containing protein [Candidatus Korarchaeota archaeon]|nr:PIN domain-containing protein [Candidatus Korarchaeota archaeon]
MIVETDVLYAYVKVEDWLKPVALRLIKMIISGKLGEVKASREVLHEIYYVSIEEGVSLDEILERLTHLTLIENLRFVETTWEDDLAAISLMRQYGLSSIFDAYYAALALREGEPLISTDRAYDKIPGIERLDPRNIVNW